MAAAEPRPDAIGQPAESGEQLKRGIGQTMLLLIVVGDILGAGIYARVGGVANEVGGAIWVSFLNILITRQLDRPDAAPTT